jgi:hypothetical protein
VRIAHVMWTPGNIPKQLECLWVVQNAAWSSTGLLAYVLTVPSVLISQTVGMVIVGESH